MTTHPNKTRVPYIMTVCALLAVIALTDCATTGSHNSFTTATQYVVFLGTNDKDTAKPALTPEAAKQKAIEILLNHFGGYTIMHADGGWISDEKIYTEYTLVIYLSNTSLEKVHAACDELLKEFNQAAILIQTNKTNSELYTAKF